MPPSFKRWFPVAGSLLVFFLLGFLLVAPVFRKQEEQFLFEHNKSLVSVSDSYRNFECTLRASGGDFTSINSWRAKVACDLTDTATKVFTVSDRGTYSSSDDGSTVTFTGGGTGTLKYINNADSALITSCSGTINTGTVTISGSGHTFTISDTGLQIGDMVLSCYNDWANGFDESYIDIKDFVTDSNHHVKIWTDPSQSGTQGSNRHDGTAESGFFINCSGNSYVFVFRVGNVIVEGLEIQQPAKPSFGVLYMTSSSLQNTFRYMIIHNVGGIVYNGGGSTIENSIFYDFGSSGYSVLRFDKARSCTVYANGCGSYSNQIIVRDAECYNVLLYSTNSGTGYNDFYSCTGDYNIGSDSSVPGSNSQKNVALDDIDFVSTTSGSEDLHIQSTSCAVDAGTDLSSYFTDDIDGDTRSSTWDIGADEYVNSSSDNIFFSFSNGSFDTTVVVENTPSSGTLTSVSSGSFDTTVTVIREWHIVNNWNITLKNTTLNWNTINDWNITLSNSSNWNIINTWNITVSNLTLNWRSIAEWNITISNTSNWNPVEIWNITLSNTTNYQIIDNWNITLKNTTITWNIIDDWNIALKNITVQWQTIQNWNITLSNVSSWNTIETWNTTLSNSSSWQIINNWNVTLTNTSSWSLTNNWNITLSNTSNYNLINNWNTTISNTTLNWNTINDWNLTISNATNYQTINDWNITLSNISTYKTINNWGTTLSNSTNYKTINLWNITLHNTTNYQNIQEWNITLSNITSWNTINEWNITLTNTTQLGWTIINDWSITLNNTTNYQNIETWNITISNKTTNWNIINLWNITLINTSLPGWNTIGTWNATLVNTTAIDWNNIQTWNMTLTNTTKKYITITNVYPKNNSIINTLYPTITFTLNHTQNHTMNYTVYWGLNKSTTKILSLDTNINNSTIYIIYKNATEYNTKYYWRIHVDDGTHNINETYTFRIQNTTSFGSWNKPNSIFSLSTTLGILVYSFVIAFLAFAYRKRRREEY